MRVGIIGTGLMGYGIAHNIIKSGYKLTVFQNKNAHYPQKLGDEGAEVTKSFLNLVNSSDVIILCLPDSKVVENIVYKDHGGLLKNCKEKQIIVDTSTSDPESTIKIHNDFLSKGVSFIDSPLTRTPKEALEGKLNTIISGPKSIFNIVLPLIHSFSENVVYCGSIGSAHKIKLVNNYMTLGKTLLAATAIFMSRDMNLDISVVRKAISGSGANSPQFQALVSFFLDEDREVLKFSIVNAIKDLTYSAKNIKNSSSQEIVDILLKIYKNADELPRKNIYLTKLLELYDK